MTKSGSFPGMPVALAFHQRIKCGAHFRCPPEPRTEGTLQPLLNLLLGLLQNAHHVVLLARAECPAAPSQSNCDPKPLV
jgi:hypothetical protein